jgi:hypothetical protein
MKWMGRRMRKKMEIFGSKHESVSIECETQVRDCGNTESGTDRNEHRLGKLNEW